MEEKKLADKLHVAVSTPEYPYLNIENLQLIGHTSECKHSFQCGFLKAECTNKECPSKFCLFGWYTAGLVPDQLCTWYEENPKWKSVGADYISNRSISVNGMIKDGLVHENKEIPEKVLSEESLNEYMFKPVTIFMIGCDDTTTMETIYEKYPFLKIGVGKPVFKVTDSEDLEQIKETLTKEIVRVPNVGTVPIIILRYKEVAKEYYDMVMKVITDYESVQSVNIATRLIYSQMIQENEFINMGRLNNAKWGYSLVDKFKGKTIMCIAGGPSLNDHIDTIKANRDKYVILAVSTVAELLFKNDIIPDIIGTLDMKNHNKVYLEALTDEQMKQSHLLFEIDANHEVIDAYTGGIIILPADLEKMPATKILAKYLPVTFKFPKSGTISNLIYNYARLLGAGEIILVGYDLCYRDNNTHTPGLKFGKQFKIVTSAGQELIVFGEETKAELAMLVDTWQDDELGNPIKAWTIKAYYTYLIELQMRIKEGGIKTYDTSKYSAKKEMAEYVDLAEFLSTRKALGINPKSIIDTVPTKNLKNNQMKHVLRNPLKGDNKQEINYNHVTRIVYMIRQYTQFPMLQYGNIMHELEEIVRRECKEAFERIVEISMNKWHKLNKEETK